MLFDAASRGRYATDASIYQVMPVGVFVPTDDADVRTAIQIARELKVPVLPRGAGTSQCGQTVGACLVIDGSKHLRNVLALDVERRTARVQPGLVLDHLNAQLKSHGLWYPVDVSTSAQATLGGMAGNNSCGSRSIAYGNMVHNVLGAHLRLADGAALHAGPVGGLSGRAAETAQFVRALADAHRGEIEAHWPRVMRRVAGYNLDIFHPQSERPYTADGGVNLAHLFIGAEGTLGFTEALDLRLQPLPRAKVLGIVNFASFHRAMDSAQHIVKLRPTAVELVDRTMIELARANPAFKPVIESALIGTPAAILLVEFSGDDRALLRKTLRELVELMADLGLPGSVVEMSDEAPQKALWEVRKAGLNIMMSLKGDGKPVSFIEDCAVPLEHLAEYTAALTEVFARHGTRGTWYAHASVGTLHVRPILDMRRDGARQDARDRRRSRGAGAQVQGRLQRRTRRRPVPRRMDPLAVRPEARRGVSRHQAPPRSRQPVLPEPHRRPAEDGRRGAVPLCAGYRTIELKPVFDWSAWNVQNDPVDRSDRRAGQRRRQHRGLRQGGRDVQQQRPLPQVRRRHDVPELSRHARRAASHARPRQHAAAGVVGPARARCAHRRCGARRARPVRGLQRLQARLPHRRRHGAHEVRGAGAAPPALTAPRWKDRVIGRLPDIAPWASRLPWLFNLRNRSRAAGAGRCERFTGVSAQRRLPAWRSDTFTRRTDALGLAVARRAARRTRRRREHGGAVDRHLQRALRARSRARRAAGAAGGRLHGARGARRQRTRAVLWPHAPGGRRHRCGARQGAARCSTR